MESNRYSADPRYYFVGVIMLFLLLMSFTLMLFPELSDVFLIIMYIVPILGSILFISAGLLIPYGIFEMIRARSTRNWETVMGKIENTDITNCTCSRPNCDIRYFEMVYSYNIMGKIFTNSEIKPRMKKIPEKGKDRVIPSFISYPEDDTIQVYYNPKKPQKSAVNIEYGIGHYLGNVLAMGIGVGLPYWGIWMLLTILDEIIIPILFP